MTFYWEKFQGPLGTQTEHFAAHSTLHDNFSMPTLGDTQNKRCHAGGNFLGKEIFRRPLWVSQFFSMPTLYTSKYFQSPRIFSSAPPAISCDQSLISLSLSYPKKVRGPANPSFAMTPTTKYNLWKQQSTNLVGVIPKEGLAGPRPPILLWVWQQQRT